MVINYVSFAPGAIFLTIMKPPQSITWVMADSTNQWHAVFFKLFVSRYHRQAVQLGGGDDKPVAGVVVDRRKLGGGNASVQFKR